MRNPVIDNLRGLCLLGVIAIHTGSLALEPGSFSLYVLLEVLSRYSVPAFFFISGYGLFCGCRIKGRALDCGREGYLAFMRRRLTGAGLPYLSWSLFYLAYFWLTLPPGYVSWQPLHLGFVLFFGLACYHLYFMVILLWFYALLPLWRRLADFAAAWGVRRTLAALLALQLAFNYWTTHPGTDASSWPLLAQNLFQYRLNYLPLHYLAVFMCGALTALFWQRLTAFLHKYAAAVLLFYAAAVFWDVYSCSRAVSERGFGLLDLANTYHQLSPQGFVYTLASLAAFCLALDSLRLACAAPPAGPAGRLAVYLERLIALFSRYSMLIYFLHPLLLDWLTAFYARYGIVMTVKKVACSYLLLICGSLLAGMLLSRLLKKCPLLSLLLTGKK